MLGEHIEFVQPSIELRSGSSATYIDTKCTTDKETPFVDKEAIKHVGAYTVCLNLWMLAGSWYISEQDRIREVTMPAFI